MSSQGAGTYLREQGEQVNQYLSKLFPVETRPATLFNSMNYSLLAGGKRLRPVLCLATARTFGVPEEQVLPAAAALELLHSYSLIHDDLPIMDNDDLRRGRPTNHKVFGDATALLAGDALLTYAFEQLAKPLQVPSHRQLKMLQVLAHAAGCYGMVGGQMADIEFEQQSGTLDDLKFIHTHKTALLIQASIEIGALFADLSEPTMSALREFGFQIGLAFQIQDDLLNVIGNPAEMGKSVGSDEKLEKLTYPRLVGIDGTEKLLAETYQDALKALQRADITAPLLTGLAEFVITRTR